MQTGVPHDACRGNFSYELLRRVNACGHAYET
jgi:hypothetical protein